MERRFLKLEKKQELYAISLISIYVAYYYYSRGSIAQISKGIIFIIVPYFYLLWLSSKDARGCWGRQRVKRLPLPSSEVTLISPP